MSVARNFRITVNLSNFFHDHRNRARIFINDEIQTISHLEDRIEKIFNIQNFHLSSQNEFLPPSEDARILQKDDIIWVMHNGENYESTYIPKVSNKKASKKSKTDGKKRSYSSTDEYMEEELRSPIKKKKKKFDSEKNKDNGSNLLNPIGDEPKKKKKKKAADNPEEIINNVNIETSSKLPSKKKAKSKMLVDNLSDKLSTTIEGSNSPKSDVMKINSLLPVLQSHIDTYNKKMTSQLNKTTSFAEIPSSTVTKECKSDDEKTQYTCKGSLSSYKRSIQIPTITDEYLKQKKINIVKIQNLSIGQESMDKEVKDNKRGGISTQDTLGKASSSQSPILEDRVKDVAENSKTLSDSIRKDSSSNTSKRIEHISIDFSNSYVKASNVTETKNKMLNSGSEKLPLGHYELSREIIQNKDEFPVKKNTSIHSESEVDNEYSKLNTTFIDSRNTSLNITGGTNINRNVSVNNAIEANSSRSSLQGVFDDNDLKNPNFISSTLNNNTNGMCIPPAAKNPDESPNSNVTVSTTRVVSRKPDTPFPQKYFFFKGMSSKSENDGENSQSMNCKSVKGKKFLLDASDIQTRKVSTENVPNEIEQPGIISKSDQLPQTSYLETTDTYEEKQHLSEELADFSDANNGHDSINQSLPSAASLKMLKDITANIMEESKIDCSRDSNISEVNLTKDGMSILDNSNISGIKLENTKFYKRKQQSGVGQLLEELRGNESVVSMESLDSDCSEFVTKRHRKRVRRRKKKCPAYSDTSFNDSSLMIVEPPIKQKPLNVKAGPSIHIKFDDDEDGEGFKVTDISKNENTQLENSSYIENITLKSDLDESKIEKPHIKDEDILKSPSMAKMLPKVGDLIAFKILRITENYTPEISSYVTGKVIEFNTESKQIVYEILSGLDQCDEPTGKLSLDPGGKDRSNRREFGWLDLIDTRLLYP